MSDVNFKGAIQGKAPEKNVWERELDLIWSIPQTFANGVVERAKEVMDNPLSAAPEVLTAATLAGLGTYFMKKPAALCRLLQSSKILAPLAKNPEALVAGITKYAPKVGLGLLGLDVGNRFAQPMLDTAFNPKNHEYDKKWLGKNLGSMVVDYPLMGAAGIGGAATVELGPGALSGLRAIAKSIRKPTTMSPVYEGVGTAKAVPELHEPLKMSQLDDGLNIKDTIRASEAAHSGQPFMRNLSGNEAETLISRYYTKAPQEIVDEVRQLSSMKPEQIAKHMEADAESYSGTKYLLERVHKNRTISDSDVLEIAHKHQGLVLPDEVAALMDIAVQEPAVFSEIRRACTNGVDRVFYGRGVPHETAKKMGDLLNDIERAGNMRFDASPVKPQIQRLEKPKVETSDPELSPWVEENKDYLSFAFRKHVEGELSKPDIIRYPNQTEVVMPSHSHIDRIIHRGDGSIDIKAKHGLTAKINPELKDQVFLYNQEGQFAGFEWIPDPTTGRLRSLLSPEQIAKMAKETNLSESFLQRAATATFDEIAQIVAQLEKIRIAQISDIRFCFDTAFEPIYQMRTIRQFGFGQNKDCGPWSGYYKNVATKTQ